MEIDVSSERAWLATALAVIAALAVGVAAVPRVVWDRFLWQYFWGPVYADAHNARCAVLEGGTSEAIYQGDTCLQAVRAGHIVAEPGYTLVSEAGYAVSLIFLVIGVLFLLRYLDVGTDRGLFFALIPFMFFGGALRVVEDAGDAAPAGVDPFIPWPWNAFIISPVIYLTVFLLTLGALIVGRWLADADYVTRYESVVAGAGIAVLSVTIGYLTAIAAIRDWVSFYPQMTVATLGGAALVAGGLWLAAERYAPAVNEGTGYMGLAILAGHAIDGVANVLAADWLPELGIPLEYGAKHPVNRIIVELTRSLQPAALDFLRFSWPFLVVKMAAALLVVYIFDRQIFEESPRYALLLLIAILAVGLGPGTRDMLRATFGI